MKLIPKSHEDLLCQWNENSFDENVEYYKTEFNQVGKTRGTQSDTMRRYQTAKEFGYLQPHSEYFIKLSACFYASKRELCSSPSVLQAFTLPSK